MAEHTVHYHFEDIAATRVHHHLVPGRGAIDFAAAVARVGSFLGYRVTVCDARPVFATSKRFPDADVIGLVFDQAALEHVHIADELGDELAVGIFVNVLRRADLAHDAVTHELAQAIEVAEDAFERFGTFGDARRETAALEERLRQLVSQTFSDV